MHAQLVTLFQFFLKFIITFKILVGTVEMEDSQSSELARLMLIVFAVQAHRHHHYLRVQAWHLMVRPYNVLIVDIYT